MRTIITGPSLGPNSRQAKACGTRSWLTLCMAAVACGPFAGSNVPKRSPLAEKWLTRAQASYKSGDFDDAKASTNEALRVAPHDDDVRLIGAQVALAKLEYGEAIRLTDGLASTEAHRLRGRAHWYAGDLELAADDLEAEIADPAVKDTWARDVAKLARNGNGRHPFAIEGSGAVDVDMPPAGSALIVPLELDGERVLGMIATGNSEVVVDAGSRHEPQWVSLRFSSLRFSNKIEVKDVPALPQDLSALSRQVGGTIKVLLGTDFLRHAHATFDRRGSQFVVRPFEAAAPPNASRVPLFYVRGDDMLMRVAVSPRDDGTGLLFVDSSQAFSLALDDAMWRKAGVDLKTLQAAPNAPNTKAGALPAFRIAGVDMPGVPAFSLSAVGDHLPAVNLDLGGVVGAAMLELFRITFADEGRFAWFEPDPTLFTTVPPDPNKGLPPPPMTDDTPSPQRPVTNKPDAGAPKK